MSDDENIDSIAAPSAEIIKHYKRKNAQGYSWINLLYFHISIYENSIVVTKYLYDECDKTQLDRSVAISKIAVDNVATYRIFCADDQDLIDKAFYKAASRGFYKTCMSLAPKTRLVDVAYQSARENDRKTLLMAVFHGAIIDPMEILKIGATTNNGWLCDWAKSRGANDFNVMLLNAAKAGHLTLCRRARYWGATAFKEMLAIAYKEKHGDICVNALEWSGMMGQSCDTFA